MINSGYLKKPVLQLCNTKSGESIYFRAKKGKKTEKFTKTQKVTLSFQYIMKDWRKKM